MDMRNRIAAVIGAASALVVLAASGAYAQTTPPDPAVEAGNVLEKLGTALFDVLGDMLANAWVVIIFGATIAFAIAKRLLGRGTKTVKRAV